MATSVKINFKMKISQGDAVETVQFDSTGELRVEKIDEHRLVTLTYEEPSMESNQTNQVKWTLRPGHAIMIRKGQMRGKQSHRLDKQTTGFLANELTSFSYGIETTLLDYDEHRIKMDYQLIMQESVQGTFQMTIDIKASKE